MAQIVNTVLISVVAFFAFLALFGYFGGVPAPAPPPATEPRLTGVSAAWNGSGGEGSGEGSGGPILVSLVVHNPGREAARSTGVAYAAVSNGVVWTESSKSVDVPVLPGRNATVRFALQPSPAAAADWWAAYGAASEGSGLTVTGSLDVVGADGAHALPFEWRSTWQGGLARSLSGATTCTPANDAFAQEPCLAAATATWAAGRLVLRLDVANPGHEDADLARGEAILRLGGETVARGVLDGARVPAGGSASLSTTLLAEPGGLSDWFPAHLARCERSVEELDIRLVRPGSPDIEWTLEGTFETHLVCGVGG